MSKNIVVRGDMRAHTWKSPDKGVVTFRPNGRLRVHGKYAEENPRQWTSEGEALGARIFVGFSVGEKPKYNLDDLIRIVRRVREEQGHDPDSSFVSQKGIFTSKQKNYIVEEDGAQVHIFDKDGVSLRDWTKEMEQLADIICTEMEQEAVIVEIQRGGIHHETFGVGPGADE